MKHRLVLIVCVAVFLVAGCKSNPKSLIQFPEGPEYVGDYLEKSDVLRIGHALSNVALRTPVKWENSDTGYQYSMMIFSSNSAGSDSESRFTVLVIDPSGDAEVLHLLGRSSKPGVWNIVAETSASPVGKAARMQLAATPIPKASMSSDHFLGFMVEK